MVYAIAASDGFDDTLVTFLPGIYNVEETIIAQRVLTVKRIECLIKDFVMGGLKQGIFLLERRLVAGKYAVKFKYSFQTYFDVFLSIDNSAADLLLIGMYVIQIDRYPVVRVTGSTGDHVKMKVFQI